MWRDVSGASEGQPEHPRLFSNAGPTWDDLQSSVLRMRLQQILRFLSRSGTKLDSRTAPPVAPAECDAVPARTDTKRSRAPDRLEVQTAIIHHLEWCVLFNEYLSVDAAGETPVAALPTASDSGLGLWLTRLRDDTTGRDAGLDELTEEHRRFHQLAQQALGHARQGRMDLASTLLNTDFERSRARVLELLRQMQKN
jgi:hypothetical protein